MYAIRSYYAPWVARYIGIPFVSGGRTIIGCDCYGLLYLAYTIELGIEIPSLADRYTDALDHDTSYNFV